MPVAVEKLFCSKIAKKNVSGGVISDLLEIRGISGHPNFDRFRRNGSFSTPTPHFTHNPPARVLSEIAVFNKRLSHCHVLARPTLRRREPLSLGPQFWIGRLPWGELRERRSAGR